MELVMDILSYCFDAAVLFVFNWVYFRQKRPEIPLYALISIYVFMEGLWLTINHMKSNICINILISVFGFFVIALFYEGSLLNRIVGVVLFQVFAIMAEILANAVLLIVSDNDAVSRDIMGMFISKIILFLLVVIMQFVQRDKGKIPAKYLLCFMIIPALSIFVLIGMNNSRDPEVLSTSLPLFVFCVLMINLISYYLLNVLAEYIVRESNALRMQDQVRVQKEKYSQLTAAFSKGNRLLHDVNKHLRYIYRDLESGNAEHAMSYIQKIDKSFERNYNAIRTGNIVVDSILSNMQTRLTEAGCDCEIMIHMDTHKIRMEDYDLVVVLGNIIDNQIEAVLQVTSEERRKAQVELSMAKRNFLIHSKNGMNEEKKKRKESERWFHGLGMQNVEEVVARYGGTISTKAENGWFDTMIVIPMEDEDIEH